MSTPSLKDRLEVLQGTLDLLVLRTLTTLDPLYGWGIARRIEQVSDQLLSMNQGTLYPALLRLEQRSWIRSKWGVSENNRKAKHYSLTDRGREKKLREALPTRSFAPDSRKHSGFPVCTAGRLTIGIAYTAPLLSFWIAAWQTGCFLMSSTGPAHLFATRLSPSRALRGE